MLSYTFVTKGSAGLSLDWLFILVFLLATGFCGILVNYATPHQKASFWTEEYIARLRAETQQRARVFYARSENKREQT